MHAKQPESYPQHSQNDIQIKGDSVWHSWLSKHFLFLVAVYFLGQTLFRLLLSPGIELDEAEQLLIDSFERCRRTPLCMSGYSKWLVKWCLIRF